MEWNGPQGRVTDHRITKSIYNLDAYMNGGYPRKWDGCNYGRKREK